jgi:hypothetical protein
MTDKERAFVRAYTGSDKRTYLHGANSARAAYNVTTDGSARSVASDVLSRTHVRAEIERIAARAQLGVQDRLRILGDIAHGLYSPETIYKRYRRNEDGSLVESGRTVVTSAPSARDRIAAVNAVSSLTGHDLTLAEDSRAGQSALDRMMHAHIDKRIDNAITHDNTSDNAYIRNSTHDNTYVGGNEHPQDSEQGAPGAPGRMHNSSSPPLSDKKISEGAFLSRVMEELYGSSGEEAGGVGPTGEESGGVTESAETDREESGEGAS